MSTRSIPGRSTTRAATVEDIVRLTMRAENPTNGPIDVSKITFVLPNDRIDKDSTLTRDPATVTTAPGDDTPWAIFSAGDGYCYAAPLPPAVGVPAGQAVRFVLGNIIVNSMPGTVHIGIIESTDRARSTTVPVVKDKLAPPGGEPSVIDEFKVDPAEVAQGATTMISWKVRNATRCLLDPGPIELPSPDSGQLSIPVHAITNFTLTAIGPAGKASSSKAVSVMPVRIDLFKAVLPRHLVVRPGDARMGNRVRLVGLDRTKARDPTVVREDRCLPGQHDRLLADCKRLPAEARRGRRQGRALGGRCMEPPEVLRAVRERWPDLRPVPPHLYIHT